MRKGVYVCVYVCVCESKDPPQPSSFLKLPLCAIMLPHQQLQFPPTNSYFQDPTATSTQTINQPNLRDKQEQVLHNHNTPALTSQWVHPPLWLQWFVPSLQSCWRQTLSTVTTQEGPEITFNSEGEQLTSVSGLRSGSLYTHCALHQGGWPCFLPATKTGWHTHDCILGLQWMFVSIRACTVMMVLVTESHQIAKTSNEHCFYIQQ